MIPFVFSLITSRGLVVDAGALEKDFDFLFGALKTAREHLSAREAPHGDYPRPFPVYVDDSYDGADYGARGIEVKVPGVADGLLRWRKDDRRHNGSRKLLIVERDRRIGVTYDAFARRMGALERWAKANGFVDVKMVFSPKQSYHFHEKSEAKVKAETFKELCFFF